MEDPTNEDNPDNNETEELEERLGKRRADRLEQPVAPVVARQNQQLYGLPQVEVEQVEKLNAPGNRSESSAPTTTNLLHTLGLTRLARRLQEPSKELRIVVNNVGIRLPVIGWDLQANALLCLVTGDVSCDLPRTSDVKIHLDEKVLVATFVGQWHKMDWLPFQVVAFALMEAEAE